MKILQPTLISVLLPVVLMACGSSNSAPSADVSGGADITVSDDMAEPGGTEFEAPLARKVTTLLHRDETMTLFPDRDEVTLGWVNDDDAEAASATTLPHEHLALEDGERLVEALGGDLDADGKAETVVLSIYTGRVENDGTWGYRFDFLRITVLDDADNDFAVLATIDEDDFDLSALDTETDSFHVGDLALGSVDDDEELEIVVIGTYGPIAVGGNAQETFQRASLLYTFDDASEGFAPLHASAAMEDVRDAKVASGDVDGDGRDEIVVTGSVDWEAEAWTFDDHEQDYEELHHWKGLNDAVFESGNGYPNVAMGDFDGDGLDEVAFSGYISSHCYAQARVFQDALSEFAYWEGKRFDCCGSIMWNAGRSIEMATGDLDGNGSDDVAVAIHDNYNPSEDRGYHLFYFLPDQDESGYVDSRLRGRIHLATGNGDRDLRDEIIVLGGKRTLGEQSAGVGNHTYTADDSYYEKRYEFVAIDEFATVVDESWDIGQVDLGGDASGWMDGIPRKPIVVAEDFDGDSTMLRYTGEHWSELSPPRIIIAMAVPPCWDDAPQDNGANTWVGYGETLENSSSEANEIAVSNSVTFSVEASDPFGIVSAEASVSLNQELTKTRTQGQSLSTGVMRQGGWSDASPDDYVVFSATEYGRFRYEIVAHEDPSLVGTMMTIDVPGETTVFKWTVGAFNEENGDSMTLGDETFSHAPGDPFSYADETRRDEILAEHGGWRSDVETVGRGDSGGNSVVLALGEQEGWTEAHSVGTEASVGVSVCGVGVETSVGITNTNIYEVTVGRTIEYSGSVGDIANDHWNEKAYKFGLFVYETTREDGAKHQILDWWVEPAPEL